MALTNEDLLAISKMLDIKLDSRLKPIDSRLKRVDSKIQQMDVKIQQMDSKIQQMDVEIQQIDSQLKGMDGRLKRVEVDLLENNIIPRLNTIEACYTSTYDRYKDSVDRMEAAIEDIELLKTTVVDHSEKLMKLA